MAKKRKPIKAKQVPTIEVTTTMIMSSPGFERGLDDVRKGIKFDWRNGDWDYERGRLFGRIAPPSMPLRIGKKLNPKGLAPFRPFGENCRRAPRAIAPRQNHRRPAFVLSPVRGCRAARHFRRIAVAADQILEIRVTNVGSIKLISRAELQRLGFI